MLIKICGLRDAAAVDAAVASGADAVGFVLVPGARRRVTPAQARELGQRAPGRLRVGVFRGQGADEVAALAAAAGVDAVQVYEPEVAAALRGAFRVILAWDGCGPLPTGADYVLCDPGGGGSGAAWPWQRVRGLPVILAGGLTPANVLEAIRASEPLGVDVSSGVETDGVKDPAKIRAFCETVRRWERGGATG